MPELQDRTVSGCTGKHLGYLDEQGWTDKTLDFILACPGCFDELERRMDQGDDAFQTAPEAQKALLMSLLEPAEVRMPDASVRQLETRKRLRPAGLIPVVASLVAGFVGAAVYVNTLGRTGKSGVTLEAEGALEVKSLPSSPWRKLDETQVPKTAQDVEARTTSDGLLLENSRDCRVKYMVGIQDVKAESTRSSLEVWEVSANPGDTLQMKARAGHKVVWVKQVATADK